MQLSQLLTTEPRLDKLLKQAKGRKVRGRRKYEAYEQYRSDLGHLVGWGAENPALRNEQAYQTAIQALGRALGV